MRRPRADLLMAALLAAASAPTGGAAAQDVVSLQEASRSESVEVPGGRIVLTHLNPAANAWMLLTVPANKPPGGSITYHLESTEPLRQRIALDKQVPGRLLITDGESATPCLLWPGQELARAAAARVPHVPLCDGRLYLRNRVPGNRSTLEATTQFLRDHVWHGEQVIEFVKRGAYRDAFAERAAAASAPASAPAADAADPPTAPAPAAVRHAAATRPIAADGLGIDLGRAGRALAPGHWYAAAGLEGVFVSAASPALLADSAPPGPALDAQELQALSFFVAFDLSSFDLGFALGTEHPRLGWSERVPPERRDARLSGPDGFDDAAPLVRTGMLPPPLGDRVVATFAGGFKREHGAFRSGPLAVQNRGSHYGFIEQGVVFSTLVPGLATLFVLDDGRVEMKTWSRDDDALLHSMRHARQNGVPLLEPGPPGEPARFGRLVDQWGAGNWSGSSDEKLRTLRAGACMVENRDRRFLVYGYFSTATPRAMAQVFQAYGCRYAMHLDMNALEHTYLALYPSQGGRRTVEHLVPGMAVLDKQAGATLLPRFVAFGDGRDFFYLVARKGRR